MKIPVPYKYWSLQSCTWCAIGDSSKSTWRGLTKAMACPILSFRWGTVYPSLLGGTKVRGLCPPPPPEALNISKPPAALSFGNFSSKNNWTSLWSAFLDGKTSFAFQRPAASNTSILSLLGDRSSSHIPRTQISCVHVSKGWNRIGI